MTPNPKYPNLRTTLQLLSKANDATLQAEALSFVILAYIPILRDNPHPHPSNTKHLVTAAKTILEHAHHLEKNSPKPQDLMIG